MSTESPVILVVDDDPDIVKAARLLLVRHGMTAVGAADPAAAWALLAETAFDAVMLDLNFARGRTSGEEGFAMLARLLAADRDAAVVVVTGHSGIAVAVQAMRAGACDFVIKPWRNERLIATIERAVALRRARRRATPASDAPEPRLLLGESAVIERVRQLVARVAPTDASVLVRGPAGSGKSLVAACVHHGSARADRPIVALDESDIEAGLELSRGATLLIEDVDAFGAESQRRLARGLSCGLAGGLVRGLADGPAGGRVIATSRLDRSALRAALTDDLLFRLNTIEIDLPPLAARADDIVPLARHFLASFAARYNKAPKELTLDAAHALPTDAWPDDVRGLRQAMERAVLLGTGERHGLEDFAFAVGSDEFAPRAIASSLNLSRGERTLVEAALKRHAFNVSRAAAELGLTRAALYRRMAKHGL